MASSHDRQVEQYFSRRLLQGITSKQCDQIAERIAGGPVVPVSVQGLCSYTVLAGPKQDIIVQFREEGVAPLKVDELSRAYEIHGKIVPKSTLHGEIGPLKVWVMPKIPGEAYVDKCHKVGGQLPKDALQRIKNTTIDLGRFFAESWLSGVKGPQDDKLVEHFRDFTTKEIDAFIETLPPRFTTFLKQVKNELPHLFDGHYPFVLTHLDLLPWNVLVGDDGHITGIIDWWDVQTIPFGVALQGVFFMTLGYMDRPNKKWAYYNEHVEIEELFWSTFESIAGKMTIQEKRSMEATQMVGYFLRYGSTWDESIGETGAYRPSRDGDEKLAFLDALLEWTVSKKGTTWSQPPPKHKRSANDPGHLCNMS